MSKDFDRVAVVVAQNPLAESRDARNVMNEIVLIERISNDSTRQSLISF
jgi:hypothetical protein